MAEPQIPQVQEPQLKLDEFVHHPKLPETQLSQWLDNALDRFGIIISWLWVVLMLVIIVNVFMRYALGRGLIVFEEIQWHIYSIGFLIGLSHCLVHDSHVRVDILYDRMSPRTQAWMELIGMLVFLLPFAVIVVIYAIPFAVNSFAVGEVSDSPGGLPYRWVIKAVLPISFVLLWLAAFSRLLRASALLFGVPKPLPGQQH